MFHAFRGFNVFGYLSGLTVAVLGALVFANLVIVELRHFPTIAIAIDELYFSTCAARGMAVGEVLTTGCHDNKPPLIFFAHMLMHLLGFGYDIVAIKIFAFLSVFAIASFSGVLAYKIQGGVAAVFSVGLVLLTFGIDAHHLALKTETVGLLFLLPGILLLCLDRASLGCRYAGGVLIGLAVLSKQTYGFVLPGLLLFLWLEIQGRQVDSAFRTFIKEGGALVVGMATPMLCAALLYSVFGLFQDFIASTFFYPALYGQPASEGGIKPILWRLASIGRDLSLAHIVCVLFLFSIIDLSPFSVRRPRILPKKERCVSLAVISLLPLLFASPIYLRYYLVPILVLMSISGGIVVHRVLEVTFHKDSKATIYSYWISMGVVMASGLIAASSWHTNGGRGRVGESVQDSYWRIEGAKPGDYAYVLGMQPEIYAYNRIFPASRIMFPWALPGTPSSWFYRKPLEGERLEKILNYFHDRNIKQFHADFISTPPKYIVLAHDMARSEFSQSLTDVPGLSDYIAKNCEWAGEMEGKPSQKMTLYLCNSRGGS